MKPYAARTGPIRSTFEQLHLLLDKHAGEQLELIDTLAERVQMLGGVAIADPGHVAEVTTIERAPNGVEEVPAMLARLLSAHEAIITAVRAAIEQTAQNGDGGSNDLLMGEWVQLLSDAQARSEAGVDNLADTRLPICVFADGTRLERPTVRQLTEQLSWFHTPLKMGPFGSGGGTAARLNPWLSAD